MKKQLQFKKFLILALGCFFISSCSNSRYGSLSKVKVDSKVTAKTDKNQNANQVIIQAENNAIEYNSEEVKIEKQTVEKTSPALTPPSINFIFKKKNILKNENKVAANEITKYVSKEQIRTPTKQEKVKQSTFATKINKTMLDNTALVLIAFFLPFVAVGLVSDWTDTSAIIISILLTLLCWLPGFIYAIDYIGKNNK